MTSVEPRFPKHVMRDVMAKYQPTFEREVSAAVAAAVDRVSSRILHPPRTWSAFLSGTPTGQGNHRTSRTGYTYETTLGHAAWRKDAIRQARALAPKIPLDGALALDVEFRLKAPKRPKARRPIGRPDCDKLLRAVCDILTLAGVIVDDALIVSVCAAKVYAFDGETGARVAIEELGA